MRRFLALLCAGVLTLSLAPAALAAAPTNDEQAGATVVTVTSDLPFATIQDTTEATANGTDPVWMQTSDEWVGERPTPIGPTVWYVYTAAESGTVVLDLAASDYGPIMLVLQSDGAVVGFAFGSTTREVLAGETYYFVIGDLNEADGLGGSLSFSMSVQAPDPVPVEPRLDVTGATVFDGYLFVTGTVAVNSDYYWAPFAVHVTQKGGKAPASGTGVVAGTYAGTWSVQLAAATGAWRAVRTTVSIDITFFDVDGLPAETFSYVESLSATQASFGAVGGVSGHFTLTDDETSEAVGVNVKAVMERSEYGDRATGQLSIKTGRFAGTYEAWQMDLSDFNGNPAAALYFLLPDGNCLVVGLGTVEGSQMATMELMDPTWAVLDSMRGTVTRGGFTITLPTT